MKNVRQLEEFGHYKFLDLSLDLWEMERWFLRQSLRVLVVVSTGIHEKCRAVVKIWSLSVFRLISGLMGDGALVSSAKSQSFGR